MVRKRCIQNCHVLHLRPSLCCLVTRTNSGCSAISSTPSQLPINLFSLQIFFLQTSLHLAAALEVLQRGAAACTSVLETNSPLTSDLPPPSDFERGLELSSSYGLDLDLGSQSLPPPSNYEQDLLLYSRAELKASPALNQHISSSSGLEYLQVPSDKPILPNVSAPTNSTTGSDEMSMPGEGEWYREEPTAGSSSANESSTEEASDKDKTEKLAYE